MKVLIAKMKPISQNILTKLCSITHKLHHLSSTIMLIAQIQSTNKKTLITMPNLVIAGTIVVTTTSQNRSQLTTIVDVITTNRNQQQVKNTQQNIDLTYNSYIISFRMIINSLLIFLLHIRLLIRLPTLLT